MFEHAKAEVIERIIRQLRKPVAIDEGLDARVMRAIAADARPARRRPALVRRWPLLAAAAAVAGLVIAQPWSQGSAVRSDSYQVVLVAPPTAPVPVVCGLYHLGSPPPPI